MAAATCTAKRSVSTLWRIQTKGGTRPAVGTRGRALSLLPVRALAAVLGGLGLDVGQVLVEYDALLARERDKALSARAADQGEARLAGEIHPPGREAGARDKDRNAHPDRLDDH